MSLLVAPVAALPISHLSRLTDERGVFEHTAGSIPRLGHGYCLDDVARALGVLSREPNPTPTMAAIAETCLRYTESAITDDGRAHNRMNIRGEWTDEPGVGDWWGRAIGALGIAAVHAPLPFTRARALRAFQVAIAARSVDVRALAFAVPGVVAVLQQRPRTEAARRFLIAALSVLPTGTAGGWDWLEPRLRYANASLSQALLCIGDALSDPRLIDAGLASLEFLLGLESRDGHLSVTGPNGRGPDESGPLFDQQPIELAAIADACAVAFQLTGEPHWREGVRQAWTWFLGDNDCRIAMVDAFGGGFDGLEPEGRNNNRGAESTLAALSTFQRARELGVWAAIA